MFSRLNHRRRLRVTAVAAAVGVAATLAAVATPSSAAPVEATGGSIEWGVRQSFRNYITSPIAHGTITTSGGVTQASGNGIFTFPVSGGSHDADTSETDAISGGSVHFEGHDGILDVLVSDVRVEIDGSSGVIIADVVSKEFIDTTTEGPSISYDDVELVSLDLDGITPTTGDGTISFADVPTTLTEDGAPAFGGFYPAGDAFDPVSFTLELDEGSGPVDPPAEDDTLTWRVSEYVQTSSSMTPAHAAGAPAVQDSTDGWIFPAAGDGTYDAETGAVDVDFAGSLTFGNFVQGNYRISIENPSFTIDAEGAGALVGDVSYCIAAACEGTWTSQPDLTVVAFDTDDDPNTITVDDDRYTITVTPPGEVVEGNNLFHDDFVAFMDTASPSLAGHFSATGTGGTNPDKPPAPLTVTFAVEDDGGTVDPPGESSDSIDIITEVQAGGLTISIDGETVVLPSPTLNESGTWLTTSGELPDVTVIDTRSTDPGWNVSAQLTDFSADDDTVDGENLGWTPSVASSSDGQTVTPGAAVAPGEGISGSALASGAAGAGAGTAVLGADLDLQVPTNTPAGTYAATLTLTAI